jgi:hypothetical protein
MKKKDARKLKLHRETLQFLDRKALPDAQGGFQLSFTCSDNQPCQSISYCYVCVSVLPTCEFRCLD